MRGKLIPQVKQGILLHSVQVDPIGKAKVQITASSGEAVL